jgi:hypothetical protein
MLKSTRPTVGAAASKIVNAANASDHSPRNVLLVNPTGNDPIYFGGPDVTTSNGITLSAGSSIPLTLGHGDDLWAVAAGDEVIQLLVSQA